MRGAITGSGRRATVGCGVLALAIAAAMLPAGAHADVIATFEWVTGTATPENPSSAATTTPQGTLTLDLSSFVLTGTNDPPNSGQYYASGANATTANITGLSYTFADGLSVNLSNVSTESVRSTTSPWQTSGLDIPGGLPTGAAAAYYLVSGLTLSGTADGANFQISNNVGTAGATYANGVGNGDNSFNGASGYAAITDGGYWKLESMAPVPLPSSLLLLLSGLGLAAFVRRNGALRAF